MYSEYPQIHNVKTQKLEIINMDAKIPHSAKVECGFWSTPEECLYDSGLIGLQYRAS